MSSAAIAALHGTKIEDVLGRKSVQIAPIIVPHTTAITDVLKLFAKHRVHSAPVKDADGRVIALFDLLDAVKYSADLYFTGTSGISSEEWKNFTVKLMLGVQSVENVINGIKKKSCTFIDTEDSMYRALELFAAGRTLLVCISHFGPSVGGGRTLEVVDTPSDIRGEYEISGILSQIDVIQHLLSAGMLPQELQLQTVDQLKLGLRSKDVSVFATLSSKAPAILALKMMYEQNITAIGVRDHETGKLVGNISASDIEGFVVNELQYLSQPVLEYVVKSRKAHNLSAQSLVSCTGSSTLQQIMELFAREKVHRIYIVDKSEQFAGVITLSDIFKCLISYFRFR